MTLLILELSEVAGATSPFGPTPTSGDVRFRDAVKCQVDIKRALIRTFRFMSIRPSQR
jgi:hypothetical protein